MVTKEVFIYELKLKNVLLNLYPTTGTWMVELKDSGLERFEKDHPQRHDEQYLMKVLLVRFNMNCYSLYSLRAGLYSY